MNRRDLVRALIGAIALRYAPLAHGWAPPPPKEEPVYQLRPDLLHLAIDDRFQSKTVMGMWEDIRALEELRRRKP